MNKPLLHAIIVFGALGNFLENMTDLDLSEFLPEELMNKVDSLVEKFQASISDEEYTRMVAEVFAKSIETLTEEIEQDAKN